MASVYGRTRKSRATISGKRQQGQALIERCRRARRDEGLAVLEGLHALKHARRYDADIQGAWSPDLERLRRLAGELAPELAGEIAVLVEPVPAELFAALAPQPPSTGVLALATRPAHRAADALPADRTAPAVFLEEPAHFGNIGAVIRVAAAAGAQAVITTGRNDPWDPAALRGAAGLHFAQPVLRLDALPPSFAPLVAIDPDGTPIDPACLPPRAIYAFGAERQGLSESLLARADQRLSLPMEPRVSSLNLATAVAATLYAWRLSSRS